MPYSVLAGPSGIPRDPTNNDLKDDEDEDDHGDGDECHR